MAQDKTKKAGKTTTPREQQKQVLVRLPKSVHVKLVRALGERSVQQWFEHAARAEIERAAHGRAKNRLENGPEA